MTSPAIKAQGTTFEIETGTGGAKTITDVALQNPFMLTSAAHALSNGDVVAMASFAGADAGDVNGNSYVVQFVTTNTFCIGYDATGKTIDDNTDTATATPDTYTEILGIKSFSKSGGGASEIDTTDLSSTAKEFLSGLVDYGEFSIELHHKIGDTGQDAVRTSLSAGTTKTYKLTLTDASVATFDAIVKEDPFSGAVDAAMGGTLNFKITGTIVWT
jgi:hypothetical protein